MSYAKELTAVTFNEEPKEHAKIERLVDDYSTSTSNENSKKILVMQILVEVAIRLSGKLRVRYLVTRTYKIISCMV